MLVNIGFSCSDRSSFIFLHSKPTLENRHPAYEPLSVNEEHIGG
jgi:hypothetical protein